MERNRISPVLIGLAVVILMVLALIGTQAVRALQNSPGSQYALARQRWQVNSIQHYRMTANYSGNYSQCYYDIEVVQDRIADILTMSCLSSAESKTLTIDGIFKNFAPYVNDKVCSPNGCYCEGAFVVRATYNAALGYPERITTFFHRSWLDDLLHGKLGVQQCLRMDPVVDTFEVVKLTVLR